MAFSVSATTRSPRGSERDGRDYWFVNPPEFRRMVEAGELVEWATVHGNLYGTPRRNVEESARAGKYLVLDIDVEGSRQIRAEVPEAVAVFVLPPSAAALADRLLARGSEPDEVRLRRLRGAATELRAAPGFDYVIVNDRLDDAVAAVEQILEAESRRAARVPEIAAACEALAAELEEAGHPAPLPPNGKHG